MPKFEVELSDGRIVDVESEQEPTEDDVLRSLSGPATRTPQLTLSAEAFQDSPFDQFQSTARTSEERSARDFQSVEREYNTPLTERLFSPVEHLARPGEGQRQAEVISRVKPFVGQQDELSKKRVSNILEAQLPEPLPVSSVGEDIVKSGTQGVANDVIAKLGLDSQTVQDAIDFMKEVSPYEYATGKYDELAVSPRQKPGATAKVLAGGHQAVMEALNFFTSPLGVATLGTGALPQAGQRAIAATFTAQMAAQAPDQVSALVEAIKKGDLEQASKAAVGLGLTATFIKQGGEAALGRHAPATKAPETGDSVSLQPKTEVAPEITQFSQDYASGKKISTEQAVQAGMKSKSVADLNALAEAQAKARTELAEAKKKYQEATGPDEKMTLGNQYAAKAGTIQLAREAIEGAVNAGSNAEGAMGVKFGERPLDWRNNPEVAEWLKANGEKLGIALPEELKSSPPKPSEQITPEAGKPTGPVPSGGTTPAPVLPPVEPPARPVTEAAVPGEGQKMRQFSERGTVAEKVPEPVQKQIATAPESFYTPQKVADVEARVKALPDDQLAAVPRDSDIKTAAVVEQVTRLFNKGQNEAGYRVFQDWSAELTKLGQVINQAKLLTRLRPEHVVTVVNKELSRAGRDPLTAEQAERVRTTSQDRITKQRELDSATDAWMKEPTDANAAKAEKALLDSNRSALEEQKLTNQFQTRSTAGLIKSILQGNLLTPISEVANIVGNINFLPFRSATRSGATAIDILDSYIRSRPREVSVAPVSGTKSAVEGLVKGVAKVPEVLRYGSDNVIKGETRVGLHPLQAWVKQFAKNPDIPTIDGKIPFSERVNLAIEGTLGVPAEIMLRGLGAGDIPFREAARGRLISEQSRLQKLSPEKAKMAKNFPELFFDKATLERINQETRGAIFQRSSVTLDHLLSWIKGKGNLFDLAVAFVAPYKLTPWNIVGEILSYNPIIAMGRTALEAKRGNKRAAEMNAAKVVVGSMLAYSGAWLYQKGLLAPSMDSKDEQQKARILAGEVLPPNHINVSGLKRAMNGGDPSFKPGDDTRDIFRAGGLAGSFWYLMANVGRDAETKPEADQAVLSLLKNSTIEQARFGLNQSFLKGIAGLLTAVQEGDADGYIQQLANGPMSVGLPNTLGAIARANREYKVDISADRLDKQIANAVKVRLGKTEDLPLKRGLWGEPVRETPKDKNALVYQFFDITKGKQVTDDPVPLELYRLWRKTADTSVIPTPPQKNITIAGQTYILTPEQRSKYAEYTGSRRKEIVSQLVTNPEWYQVPDEAKIKILDEAYRNGLEYGKATLFEELQGNLTPKPERAGFVTQ